MLRPNGSRAAGTTHSGLGPVRPTLSQFERVSNPNRCESDLYSSLHSGTAVSPPLPPGPGFPLLAPSTFHFSQERSGTLGPCLWKEGDPHLPSIHMATPLHSTLVRLLSFDDWERVGSSRGRSPSPAADPKHRGIPNG